MQKHSFNWLIMYQLYLNTYNLTYSVQLENATPPKSGRKLVKFTEWEKQKHENKSTEQRTNEP